MMKRLTTISIPTIKTSAFIRIVLCLFGLLISTSAWSFTYVGETLSLGGKLLVYEDRHNSKRIEDIIALPELEQNGWQMSTQRVPNYGYIDHTVWFKAPITNQTQHVERLVLHVDYPLLDELDVFVVRADKIQALYETGDTRLFNTRPVHHHDLLFPLQLLPAEQVEIYLRAKSDGSLQLPLQLIQADQFWADDQSELAAKHLYYGIILIMALYNLFLFLAIRDRVYLYYVGFVTSFGLLQVSLHGLGFQYFFANNPQHHQLSVLILVPFTVLFACGFSLTFLDLKRSFC